MEFTVGAPRRRLVRDKGCKPIKIILYNNPGSTLLYIRKQLKSLKEHTLLELKRSYFVQTCSNTIQFAVWPLRHIETTEPANVKTILSLDFKIWIVGDRRKDIVPVFGDGIFNRDGPAWQRSRDMLRPHFARSQIADLNMFEKHVRQLLHAIPRDGSTVDLQPLFFRLTLDTATEFLFGESTHSLAPDADAAKGEKFTKAFDRCQDPMARGGLLQALGLLPAKPQFKKDCKTIHGEWSATSLYFTSQRNGLVTETYVSILE